MVTPSNVWYNGVTAATARSTALRQPPISAEDKAAAVAQTIEAAQATAAAAAAAEANAQLRSGAIADAD